MTQPIKNSRCHYFPLGIIKLHAMARAGTWLTSPSSRHAHWWDCLAKRVTFMNPPEVKYRQSTIGNELTLGV